MDKKNTTIGVLLLITAVAVLLLSPRIWPPAPKPIGPEAPLSAPATTPQGNETPDELVPSDQPAPTSMDATTVAAPPSQAETPLFASVESQRADEQFVTLSNDFVDVRFTNFGGAIAEIALKKYLAKQDSDAPYVMNVHRVAPALGIRDFPGVDVNAAYTLVSKTANTIVWRAAVSDQLEVERTYRIAGVGSDADPYLIEHSTRFRNLTGQTLSTRKLIVSLGTAEPIDAKDPGYYLNVGVYNGDDADFVGRNKFEPGFLSKMFGGNTEIRAVIPMTETTVWASVKNQFFTAVFTPEKPGTGVTARRVELPLIDGETKPRVAITGSIQFDPYVLPAGGSETLNSSYYAGPKEYDRLVRLGAEQDKIMQFGFFGFFSKLLLYLLKFLQQYVGNWGVAIICTTLLLRTMMWPLTASAARSAKRMAKIQGPMKEIQEKYKDNKAKQQEAMLGLFKQHKVNPVGGCLPMFFQIPIFFGLFRMLRSASELRFADFLWIHDLSAPDTIGHLFGFPVNIMPIFMGASMVVQMRMTPTPTVDNPSAKMMKFMPYMMTIMCYNFSSGLAVYWTASNLFSIFQQWVTNRRKDPVEAAKPAESQAAKQPRKGLPVARKKKR